MLLQMLLVFDLKGLPNPHPVRSPAAGSSVPLAQASNNRSSGVQASCGSGAGPPSTVRLRDQSSTAFNEVRTALNTSRPGLRVPLRDWAKAVSDCRPTPSRVVKSQAPHRCAKAVRLAKQLLEIVRRGRSRFETEQ